MSPYRVLSTTWSKRWKEFGLASRQGLFIGHESLRGQGQRGHHKPWQKYQLGEDVGLERTLNVFLPSLFIKVSVGRGVLVQNYPEKARYLKKYL